jgi:uncharacterized protein YqeY
MTLKEQILSDLQKAMKAGDRRRLETLRGLKASLTEKEIEKRGSGSTVTAVDELAVLTASAKKRRESIELFEKGGRTDLVRAEQEELTIIQEYLPQPLSRPELEQRVRTVIDATGASGLQDFGKVMPLVMKEVKGRADGKLVQELVRTLLGAG